MSGECEECKKKLQRSPSGKGGLSEIPPIVHDALRSPGQTLDARARSILEPRFGYDFGRVRIHTDALAAASARAVGAHAYTVGHDIVFADQRYQPARGGGLRLLAHELAHVVQQSGSESSLQPRAVIPEFHATELEADSAADSILRGGFAKVRPLSDSGLLQRDKDDLVRYTGGTSGFLIIEQSGKEIYRTRAVSGHPGTKEYEKDAGPIPTGTYQLRPGITHSPVSKLEGGTCGASGIWSGYQELTSKDPSPCDDPPSHYCTVSCPAPGTPGRMCFTPVSCWGEKRMKIEGSVEVGTPTGATVTRNGFFIHGGDHSVAVTSGCVKVFDNAAFDELRKLKGKVAMCVGTACPAPAVSFPRPGEPGGAGGPTGTPAAKCATLCASLASMTRSVQGICRLAGEKSKECVEAREKYNASSSKIVEFGCKC